MIKKLTNDFIAKFVKEFNKEENKTKINNEILTPIFSSFSEKIYPYVTLLFVLYTFNLLIIITILLLIIFK